MGTRPWVMRKHMFLYSSFYASLGELGQTSGSVVSRGVGSGSFTEE